MAENFYADNPDLRFRMNGADLAEVVALKEKGYSYAASHRNAPRNYADAKDNWNLILDILGEICGEIIAPLAPETDEEGATYENGEVTYAHGTQEALKAFRSSEVLGAMLPWEYGGMNLPETVYQAMIEMVSRAEGGLMTIFSLQEIGTTICEFGNEDMKARILPLFARGEVLGSMDLTEPDAGSDLGAVQTKAHLDEATGKWYINGVKRFITNGCADIHLVLARSEKGTKDARGLSMFTVRRDSTMKIRRIENKLGIHSSPTCEIQFKNTPAELCGERKFGLMRCAMALMNGARLAVASQATGIAEAAYREALRYARERAQFGKAIDQFPAVSRMLLSMKCELEAARAIIFDTAVWVDRFKAYEQAQAAAENPSRELIDKKKAASSLADMLTPMCKFYGTEMGNRVCYKAMQIHAGVGYMREFNVERHYRDVRITNIYEGTTQLQVVAAIGKLAGGRLGEYLQTFAALDFGPGLASLRARAEAITADLDSAVESLKDKDRETVDYYGGDLVELGCLALASWLLLRDAREDARKAEVAAAFIAENAPRAAGLAAAVKSGDMSALRAKAAILG